MIITQIRNYEETCTLSTIYVNNEQYCYALENVARPANVKIHGNTCIPEGCYKISIHDSPRFKRELLMLSSPSVEDDSLICRSGVLFSHILVHSGNNIDDTEGCVLVGAETDHKSRIWNCRSVERGLVSYVKNALAKTPHLYWVVTS